MGYRPTTKRSGPTSTKLAQTDSDTGDDVGGEDQTASADPESDVGTDDSASSLAAMSIADILQNRQSPTTASTWG